MFNKHDTTNECHFKKLKVNTTRELEQNTFRASLYRRLTRRSWKVVESGGTPCHHGEPIRP